jgi:hypothetical protein
LSGRKQRFAPDGTERRVRSGEGGIGPQQTASKKKL